MRWRSSRSRSRRSSLGLLLLPSVLVRKGPGKAWEPVDSACDPAGVPDDRRPGDDVVDIALDVMEGYLLGTTSGLAPAAGVSFTDGVQQQASQFGVTFP
jgi:hypothetical protein